MPMKFPTLAAFAMLLLAGCVNPYKSNFNSTQSRYPTWIEPRLAPKTGTPELRKVDNIESQNWQLLEKGFIMIGFSKFDAPTMDDSLALNQARTVGADIVLLEKKFSKTLTETVAVTGWPADQTQTTDEDVIVTGPDGTHVVNRRSETTVSSEPETTYVPHDVDYFQYSSTYWRKLQKPVFGAFVQDLSDPQKQKLQTNQGLVIQAVIVDSPAFKADLLKGDIILQIDGAPAPSAQKFYGDIVNKTGKEIELSIMRRDQKISKRVPLNT